MFHLQVPCCEQFPQIFTHGSKKKKKISSRELKARKEQKLHDKLRALERVKQEANVEGHSIKGSMEALIEQCRHIGIDDSKLMTRLTNAVGGRLKSKKLFELLENLYACMETLGISDDDIVKTLEIAQLSLQEVTSARFEKENLP